MATPPAVELRNIRKVFTHVVANDGVNLRVEKGTIHGLVGENGAGKSTTMKILYGIYRPDAGQILIDGQERKWNSPADAIEAGIGMVHQHFMLAGPYSALDNILLGSEPTHEKARYAPRAFRPLDRIRARRKLQRLAEQYGLPVDWDVPVEKLPVGIQQRIEILKLLYRDARILILDEPTAVLTPQETNELFENLKKLKSEGKTILIVTHKLREVMSFTDHVTVLRGGKMTGEVATSETSPQDLADRMVGRKVVLQVEIPPQPALGKPALKLSGLSLHREGAKSKLSNVTFEIRSGEIVGIAGVEGNGQSELLQALLHPSDPECRTAGGVEVLGQDISEWETDRIKASGVGIVPEDRHLQGLLLERPLTENFVLGFHGTPEYSRNGFMNGSAVLSKTAAAVQEYDVRPPVPSALAGDLSGGNQQKLIIAREFSRKPRFLIAAQPTRGVDVGAIEFIHKRIIEARQGGAGVLLVSSELDEILSLSDRILVFYEGQIVAQYERGKVSERELGLKMGGAQ